ncbi:MAG: rod shape-determining protein MreC [Lentisphaerae bacterium]|nr:rod shape-determining protein MreC [Lentisphaerota bacterium]
MQRKFVKFILLLLLPLLLVFVPNPISGSVKKTVRDLFAPFFSAANKATETIKHTFKDGAKQEEEIITLLAENRELKANLTLMEELRSENRVLRNYLRFAKGTSNKLIGSTVIVRDFGDWWRSVIIDRGSKHGISIAQPVITPDGLVGKIISVSEYTSEVLLITDPSCKVAVTFKSSAGNGIMSGEGNKGTKNVICRTEFVTKDVCVADGEEVVTSGLGGIFPANIPVGKARAAKKHRAGLYQTAEVVPNVDLIDLSYVFVIETSSPNPRSLKGER